jgi:hypothetical protein
LFFSKQHSTSQRPKKMVPEDLISFHVTFRKLSSNMRSLVM